METSTKLYVDRSLNSNSQVRFQCHHAQEPRRQHLGNQKTVTLLSIVISLVAFITGFPDAKSDVVADISSSSGSVQPHQSIINACEGAVPIEDVPAAVGPQFIAPKTVVDSALYDDFVRYAGYPISAFIQPCSQNPPYGSAVVEGYVNIPSSDTQATLYREDSTREFVLAFPGTQSLQDFLTDVFFIPFIYFGPEASSCHGCLVHSGFQLAWGSARGAVIQLVTDALTRHPSYELNIAGFSLGGALAHLAFLDLVGSSISVSNVYTYAQPRIGNQPFADFTDLHSGASSTDAGIFHRITHTDDGITQAPPPGWGFAHCGTEYWEMDNISVNPIAPTVGTTFRCFGQEASDCNAAAGRFGSITDAHFSYAGFDPARAFCH